jgi:hypothetical protein
LRENVRVKSDRNLHISALDFFQGLEIKRPPKGEEASLDTKPSASETSIIFIFEEAGLY